MIEANGYVTEYTDQDIGGVWAGPLMVALTQEDAQAQIDLLIKQMSIPPSVHIVGEYASLVASGYKFADSRQQH